MMDDRNSQSAGRAASAAIRILPSQHAALPQLQQKKEAMRSAKVHADGDYEGALKDYREALALNPDDAETLLKCGNSLFNLGRIDQHYRRSSAEILAGPNPDGPGRKPRTLCSMNGEV